MIKLFYGQTKVDFTAFEFSGLEISVKVPIIPKKQEGEKTYLYCKNMNGQEIMTMLFLIDALNHIDRKPILILPYLPYARQDRICAKGESDSLYLFGQLLNLQKLDQIHTLDCHSNHAFYAVENLLDHVNTFHFSLRNEELIKKTDLVICPDQGARTRTAPFKIHVQKQDVPTVSFMKKRDPETGKIIEYGLENPEQDIPLIKSSSNILIVDDICDGGRTFINIAEEILKHNPVAWITLLVSHGIFSRGFDVFKDKIHFFITSNSFESKFPLPKNVRVYPAFSGYNFLEG